VGGRNVTVGTGNIISSAINTANRREYLVNLAGVTNAQRVTVGLTSVVDVAGNTVASVAATVGILRGDTNADGFVDSADISQTKSQSGMPFGPSNFREDPNLDAVIDSADISFTKSFSGTALPSNGAAAAPQSKRNQKS